MKIAAMIAELQKVLDKEGDLVLDIQAEAKSLTDAISYTVKVPAGAVQVEKLDGAASKCIITSNNLAE